MGGGLRGPQGGTARGVRGVGSMGNKGLGGLWICRLQRPLGLWLCGERARGMPAGVRVAGGAEPGLTTA